MSDVKTVDSNTPTDKQEAKNCCTCWDKSFALIMIFICALGLLIPFALHSWNHKTNEITVRVTRVDSIPQGYALNATDAAKLFQEIEKKELKLEERYNYVLKQKEHEYRWQNYLSYVIGIIVSICGFFGYKSIRDLKDDVNSNMTDIAEKETKKYLEKKIDKLVNKKVEDRMDAAYQSEIMEVAIDKLKLELLNDFERKFDELLIGAQTSKEDAERNEVVERMNELDNESDYQSMF